MKISRNTYTIRKFFSGFSVFATILFFGLIGFIATSQAVFAQQSATISVYKNIDGQPAQDWEFNLGYNDVQKNKSTDNNGYTEFTIEIPDESVTANLSEILQTGYDLISAECVLEEPVSDDPNDPPTDPPSQTTRGIFNDDLKGVEDIEIFPEENISCTFTNHLHTFCGDGIIQELNDNNEEEGCDGESGVPDHFACTLNCSLEYIPYCGDGWINQNTEECDGDKGITDSQTCSPECLIIEQLPREEPDPIDKELEQIDPYFTLTKSVDKLSANPGDTLKYTIKVINLGDGDAVNLTLTDTLPSGFIFINHNNLQENATQQTWTRDALRVGEEFLIEYSVLVGSSVNEGIYENSATVTADNYDHQATDKVATEIKPALMPEPEIPSLEITKSINKEYANPGDNVIFTINVTNSSNILIKNVKLNDVLPAGLTFADSQTTAQLWDLGDIIPAENITQSYEVQIDDSALTGTYTNIATVSADGIDDISAQATFEVRAIDVLGASEDTSALLPITGGGLTVFLGAYLLAGTGLLIKRKII